MEKVKYLLSMLFGIVFGYLEKYRFLYVMVGVAVLLDLVTGMAGAVISGQGLSSGVARRGLIKKLVLLVGVAFGTFLDVLLPWCAQMVGLQLDGGLMFSAVICVYICVGESISILENIFVSTGVRLPRWITALLEKAKDKMENNE